jgi:dolichol-phosphate mannosyltransferase
MLSCVIPVLNEAESLGELYGQIREVAKQLDIELEIIFVDDGSTDASWEKITSLSSSDPRVNGIRFRRNFGKAAALSAGFHRARGHWVMTLDADLQDDPREIPRFLEAIQGDLDVVSGWKKHRHDPWHKVGPSRIFNRLVSWMTGVRLHDHNCGFKCYRQEVLKEVQLYGELHRFVPVLADARGFRVGELVVRHHPRKFGQSKYGVRRFVKGFLDLLTVKFLTGFGERPQHVLGTFGLLSFFAGFAGLTYLAGYWIVDQLNPDWEGTPLHQRPLVIYCVGALLLGGQLVSIGFLAELITAHQARDAMSYSIAQTTYAAKGDAPANDAAPKPSVNDLA